MGALTTKGALQSGMDTANEKVARGREEIGHHGARLKTYQDSEMPRTGISARRFGINLTGQAAENSQARMKTPDEVARIAAEDIPHAQQYLDRGYQTYKAGKRGQKAIEVLTQMKLNTLPPSARMDLKTTD